MTIIEYEADNREELPERELMAAVLDRALTDMKGTIEKTGLTSAKKLRTMQRDPCLWILGHPPYQHDYLFSFKSICMFLKLGDCNKIKKLAKEFLT